MVENAAAQPQPETPKATAADNGAQAAAAPASFYIGSDIEEHTEVQEHKPLGTGASESKPEATGKQTGTVPPMWWHTHKTKETAPGTKATAEEPPIKTNKIETLTKSIQQSIRVKGQERTRWGAANQ